MYTHTHAHTHIHKHNPYLETRRLHFRHNGAVCLDACASLDRTRQVRVLIVGQGEPVRSARFNAGGELDALLKGRGILFLQGRTPRSRGDTEADVLDGQVLNVGIETLLDPGIPPPVHLLEGDLDVVIVVCVCVWRVRVEDRKQKATKTKTSSLQRHTLFLFKRNFHIPESVRNRAKVRS